MRRTSKFKRKLIFALSALAGSSISLMLQKKPKEKTKLVLRHLNSEVKANLETPDLSGFEGLHEEHYKEIRLADVLSLLIDHEKALVVMGDKRWMKCQEAMPVLDKALVESETDIYYVDAGKETNRDLALWDALISRMALFINEEDIYVPTVLYINDGKVMAAEVGTFGLKGQALDLESESDANELFSIYCHMIMDFKK